MLGGRMQNQRSHVAMLETDARSLSSKPQAHGDTQIYGDRLI